MMASILHENGNYATIARIFPSRRRNDNCRKYCDCRDRCLASRFFGVGDVPVESPIGRKTFKMTKEVSEASAMLAANQGLYNGFLAAVLIWGLVSGQFSVKVFFLTCILIAGIFGGVTAKRSILYV